MVVSPSINPATMPYQRYGAAIKLWRSSRREVLISGPAGTGKTRASTEKLHFCANKYPGMRALMVRKTRQSLTQSAMVTYEQKVLPHGWLGNVIKFRTQEQEYRYPNGSIIAVGGLDKASKVMSSEWDMIYVPEATELMEDDWGALTTRLRNGKMPYQQLLADCNPGAPNHWLKTRCDRGQCLMLHSRHEDNPTVTPEYLEALRNLPGVLKLRLYDGVWAAAEGMVYQDEWDPAIHLIDRFDIPSAWDRYWAIDFGFRNPFVWQAWAQNPDGELFRYREIYRTGCLVEDLAKEIRELTKHEPRPKAVVCDHDAEDRATFEKHAKQKTTKANKAVGPGIQEVKARLRIKANGRASLYFLRDSLVGRDRDLEAQHLPFTTEMEFENYVWDIANGRKSGEEPVKKFDHGQDGCRYLCMQFAQPISSGGGILLPNLEDYQEQEEMHDGPGDFLSQWRDENNW